MNIYKMKKNDIKELKREFNATSYGSDVFLSNYAASIIFLIFAIMCLVQTILYALTIKWFCAYYLAVKCSWFMIAGSISIMIILLFLTVISYFKGNVKYLSELRKYAEAKDVK